MATRSIKLVQFGALTAQDWRAFAIEIHTASNRGSTETTGTPHDDRLGALANGAVCVVCGEKNNKCPGHWGRIELEEPCYNPEYIEIVVGILKCICHKCINPRISESVAGAMMASRRSFRFKAYKKKAETIRQCSECSEILPNFFADKYGIKMFYGDRSEAVSVTAREACAILTQISSETMKLLGFNDDLSENQHYHGEALVLPQDKMHVHEVRPEAFLFEVLPVLPTCARPWVIKGNDRKDDDLTDKYNTILKINTRLKADREAPINAQPIKGRKKTGKLAEADKKKSIEDLSSNIWSLLDNSGEKGKNNNRQHKGLRERLGTKEGHIQNNVAGKRCDQAARTVIVGGGDMIRMEEIGVPGFIAKTITVPELVLEWNMKAQEELLAAGKINLVCRGGFIIDVAEVTAKNTKPFIWKERPGLQVYDIIHRQFRTGDWGLFNRQPTLRLESMQGIRCVVLEDELVFRVPLGVTRPYNADQQ
jgi:DNA-directed RNA polymerase beta' subunit